MYGYPYVLVSRGLYDQSRSPYGFEPGEPDDVRSRTFVKGGGWFLAATYLMVVGVIAAALWIGGDDQPVTNQARRATNCVHATELWSGCLPTK